MKAFHRDLSILIISTLSYFLINAGLTPVFIPKAVEVNAVSPMVTYTTFYEMPLNSIDVLFMGTSHMYNGISPRYLREHYGIDSYNLASSMQSTAISYFWLKESLNYQTPKVVVFDVYNMFSYPYTEKEDILWNSREGQLRIPIDWMRMTKVKCEAIKEICNKDSRISIESMFFPMIRYHQRWETLEKVDYILGYLNYLKAEKGYKYVTGKVGAAADYQPIDEAISLQDDLEKQEELELRCDYIDQFIALCKSKNIKVLLIRTPYLGASVEEYEALKKYAEGFDCEYIDFNTKSIYEAINFNFAEDSVDIDHANANGAEKMTDYIGLILKERYNL